MNKLRVALGIVTAFISFTSFAGTSAEAGGWAVTTLDPMVAPVAGDTMDVGLTIRQHGVTPVAVDGVMIVVTGERGTQRQFPARAEGAVGHYVAEVEFPTDGRYTWTVIQGWFGPQDLGTVDVPPPNAAAPEPGSRPWPLIWRLVFPCVALVLLVAAIVERRRPKRVVASPA